MNALMDKKLRDVISRNELTHSFQGYEASNQFNNNQLINSKEN